MNIWIFNHYAIGPGSSGGTRHYDLSRQLVKRGHTVTIFASSFNYQTLKEEHLQESKEEFLEKVHEGVKFIWIKSAPYSKNDHHRVLNMMTYSKRALAIAKSKNERPDIVIGSLVHPLAAYVGYLVAKNKKSVFYFEERDLWPQTLIDLGKISEKNPVIFGLAAIEKFLYKKAKRIIVLFDKAVGYVTSKGIDEEKVLYMPNGIDLNRSENKEMLPDEVTAVLKKNEDKVIAIYTGAHGIANNLDAILDAAKLLLQKESHVHFVFVGNGPEKKRLIKRVENEKITNADFLNSLPKEAIPSLLENCDIGLLPLKDSPVFKWGISPNKLFDYMGASLPVALLCNLEGTPVEHANGGFIIKQNFSQQLADVLDSTLREELKQLGQNGRTYVEVEHNWSLLAEKLEYSMREDI